MHIVQRWIAVILVCLPVCLFGQVDANRFSGMKWRLIGPFRGGRVEAVAGVPADPRVYYFGAVAGGVWKTTDGGLTWKPLFDRQRITSIGAMAVAPSDPNVIYVGTGEACIRNDISYGDGVYKSTDAGHTWTNVGLNDSRHIGRIAVDPKNPDVVFVAALGHAYGPNPERGVFRSTDGGKTWQKVLYKDENSGAIDVVMDPNNPRILFAALWDAHRTPYSLTSGGPGSGLFKSSDGGNTWRKLEGHGLPGGTIGRIGVAVAADSSHVYAAIEAKENAIYRSDDGGESWQMVNNDTKWVRPWYFNHIFADPKHSETVYMLDLGVYRSTDGGRIFTPLPTPHGDNHALWIDPADPQRLIDGNDGGATISIDGGRTWTQQDNQPTAQFYHVATDNRFNYHVYGAQQDNTTVAIASRTDFGIIDEHHWYPVGGGESGAIVPDPRDPNIVYAGDHNQRLTRYDLRTGQIQDVSPWADSARSHAAADQAHRFQWTFPLFLSPHDPQALYAGGDVLFKSTNAGMSWSIISPDLSRNDKSKQQSSGGPLTPDDSSAEYYDTIFALAESPLQKGMIWAGTDDGLVHLTQDDGKHWANVTPKQMPEWSLVSMIEASRFEPATAYMAVDRHRLDDFKPYIYKTADSGKSWTLITAGLPDREYVHVVREDAKRKGLLFAGTENGAYVSFDDGTHWQPLQLNLPHAPVYDLALKNNDLIAATHGRAFWILDDIAPLRQAASQTPQQAAWLYEPSPAFRVRSARGFQRSGPNVGQNPPGGAVIDYYLASAPNSPITLEITDSAGRLVRRYSSRQKQEAVANPYGLPAAGAQSLPAAAGMNRFAWDLRYQPAEDVRGMTVIETRAGGPLALPGVYQLKLTANGVTATRQLELKLDPRVQVSAADLQKQFDFAMKVRDKINLAHETVNQIRDLRSQLELLRKRKSVQEQKPVASAIDDADHDVTGVEGQLIQLKSTSVEGALVFPVMLDAKFASLANMAESADTAPPQQAEDTFQDLSRRLDTVLASWRQLQTTRIAALDEMLRKERLPTLALDWTATTGR